MGQRTRRQSTHGSQISRTPRSRTSPGCRPAIPNGSRARRSSTTARCYASDLPAVMQAKYELLNRSGVLAFEYDTAQFADLGGMARLKEWLRQRRPAFDGSAPQPRGPQGPVAARRAGLRQERRRQMPPPASTASRCCGSISPRSTTSTSASPNAICARRWRRLTSWRPACCGSTRSRKALRPATATAARRAACSARS